MASFVDPLGSVPAPSPLEEKAAPPESQDRSRSPSPPPPPTPAKAVFSPTASSASFPDSPLHAETSPDAIVSPQPNVWRGVSSPLHSESWSSPATPPADPRPQLHIQSSTTVQRPTPQSPSSQPRTPSSFSPGPPRSPFTDIPPPSLRASKVYDEEAAGQIAVQRERDRQQGHTNGVNGNVKDKADLFVKVQVRGLERVRKELWVKVEASVRAFLPTDCSEMLKRHAQTNLSSYHTSHIKPLSRSYAEFVAFHSALASNHPEHVLPALPLGSTSAATDEEEERLLRNAFQRWFDRITRDPSLMVDDELKSFLESSFGVSSFDFTPKNSRAHTEIGSCSIPLRPVDGSSRRLVSPNYDLIARLDRPTTSTS
jgi:hypothetical protein